MAGYPDDASPEQCLEYLKWCLDVHQSDVRIVGNLPAFGKCSIHRAIKTLEAKLTAADYLADVSEEFLNDFLNNKSCVPGALKRAIEGHRKKAI
jgi:hypothetical protein